MTSEQFRKIERVFGRVTLCFVLLVAVFGSVLMIWKAFQEPSALMITAASVISVTAILMILDAYMRMRIFNG